MEAVKKTAKLWTLSEKGVGVSGAAKLFIEIKYGHVPKFQFFDGKELCWKSPLEVRN